MNSPLLLPHPNDLLKKSKSLAMLDAIYCQQWDLRYFSHNSLWGAGEEMGSMRDGEGNYYFILFMDFGAAMKGCFPEGGLSGNKKILDKTRSLIPLKFKNFMDEPAFSIAESSFFTWFDNDQIQWEKIGSTETGSEKDDGSQYLTEWLTSDEEFYVTWASEYYEITIDKNLVKHIFDFHHFHMSLIEKMNINLDESQLIKDINEIGYPHD